MRFNLKAATDVLVLLGTVASTFYLYRMMSSYDTQSSSAESQRRIASNARRIDKKVVKELNPYETAMLEYLVEPEEIDVGFEDVGGLDSVVEELRESVIFPLVHHSRLGGAQLLRAPPGVLFYGPPGCGKTMLAKAIARESGANFLNVPLSALMNKWYGESNKLIAGLFSLAHKLAPCIIFIDEIDSVLRVRQSSDHEASTGIKAEFMTQWDGLSTPHSKSTGIMVLGATNRMFDIDEALLRRMPLRFHVPKPGPRERRRIMEHLLENVPLATELDWDMLVNKTEGMSGSDLEEFCRSAGMRAVKRMYRSQLASKNSPSDVVEQLQPLTTADFVYNGRVAELD